MVKKSVFLCYTTQVQVSFLRGEYRLVRGTTFCVVKKAVSSLKVVEKQFCVLCLHVFERTGAVTRCFGIELAAGSERVMFAVSRTYNTVFVIVVELFLC